MLKKDILRIYTPQLKSLGVNINTITKDELLQIVNFRCNHKHSPFTHPGCFRRSGSKLIEKIAMVDIETSNLAANFGIILSWCIKPLDEQIVCDYITNKDIVKGYKDKRIVGTLIEELLKYSRVVGHYSSRFDVPFVRTRALKHDISFPEYGKIYHTDTWMIARRKLCLHSNRQGVVGEAISSKNIKTRIHPEIWLDMQFGSPALREKAIKYIVSHNKKDVIQLEQNYKALRKFVKEGRSSI